MLARRATYQERKSDLPTPAACLRPYSLRDVCRWNASEKDSRGRRGRLTTRPGSQSFGTLGGPSSIGLAAYFFAPTDRFLSRRSDPRHFLHLVAGTHVEWQGCSSGSEWAELLTLVVGLTSFRFRGQGPSRSASHYVWPHSLHETGRCKQ